MNVALDLDGTIDSFPRECQSMISAFHAAGFHVFILSGVDAKQVTQADIDTKRQYLTGLGISSDLYASGGLILCPDPHPANKAKAIEDNNIDMLFDNSKANAQAAKTQCPVWLLWNSKVKQ